MDGPAPRTAPLPELRDVLRQSMLHLDLRVPAGLRRPAVRGGGGGVWRRAWHRTSPRPSMRGPLAGRHPRGTLPHGRRSVQQSCFHCEPKGSPRDDVQPMRWARWPLLCRGPRVQRQGRRHGQPAGQACCIGGTRIQCLTPPPTPSPLSTRSPRAEQQQASRLTGVRVTLFRTVPAPYRSVSSCRRLPIDVQCAGRARELLPHHSSAAAACHPRYASGAGVPLRATDAVARDCCARSWWQGPPSWRRLRRCWRQERRLHRLRPRAPASAQAAS